jgi:hypothetical protein
MHERASQIMICDMGSMTFGMGLLGLLFLAAVLLVVAAAVKYLFFDKRNKEDNGPRAPRSPSPPP